jgi:hypothetical protein
MNKLFKREGKDVGKTEPSAGIHYNIIPPIDLQLYTIYPVVHLTRKMMAGHVPLQTLKIYGKHSTYNIDIQLS